MTTRLEHVERARPPWRTIRLTECGRTIEDGEEALSFDAVVAKVKREGQQRAAMSTCMTCWGRAGVQYGRGGAAWETYPSGVIERDVTGRRRDLVAEELRALTILYERHRDEYHEIHDGLAATLDLAAARTERDRRRA